MLLSPWVTRKGAARPALRRRARGGAGSGAGGGLAERGLEPGVVLVAVEVEGSARVVVEAVGDVFGPPPLPQAGRAQAKARMRRATGALTHAPCSRGSGSR